MKKIAAYRKAPLIFETEATARYLGHARNIVIEPDTEGHVLRLRLKGTKVRYEISWGAIFDRAALCFANAERMHRLEKKAARRTLNVKPRRKLNGEKTVARGARGVLLP